MEQWLFELLKFVIGGSIVAFITVRLALRRFYSEKWWERKCALYLEIVSLIHSWREIRIRLYSQVAQGWDMGLPAIPSHEDQTQAIAISTRINEIRELGALQLDSRAVDILWKFSGAIHLHDPKLSKKEMIGAQIDRSQSCLVELQRIAREDLNLGKSKWKSFFIQDQSKAKIESEQVD